MAMEESSPRNVHVVQTLNNTRIDAGLMKAIEQEPFTATFFVRPMLPLQSIHLTLQGFDLNVLIIYHLG